MPFLGIYPRGKETYVHTKTCAQKFTAALFINAKTWKPPKCPSAGEWLNSLFIHMMEYCSGMKGMNYWYTRQLLWIWKALRENSLKDYCTFPFIWLPWKGKKTVSENSTGAARGYMWGRSCDYKEIAGGWIFWGGVIALFYILIMMGITQHIHPLKFIDCTLQKVNYTI